MDTAKSCADTRGWYRCQSSIAEEIRCTFRCSATEMVKRTDRKAGEAVASEQLGKPWLQGTPQLARPFLS